MHDGAYIVLDVACRDFVPVILFEVAFKAGLDVLKVDIDVFVSVWSRLLVMEPDGVSDLMSNNTELLLK